MLTRRPLGERYDAAAPLYVRDAGATLLGLRSGDRIPDTALTGLERGQWWRIGRADHARPTAHLTTMQAPQSEDMQAPQSETLDPDPDALTHDELDALTAPEAVGTQATAPARCRRSR